jgi:hypothetical protein
MKAGRHLIGLIGMFLTATALAAGPQSQIAQSQIMNPDGKAAGEAGGSIPDPNASRRSRGPRSPAQDGVTSDYKDGRQNCQELTGSERAACLARAAATAESPRGREGANPTGKSKPPRGIGERAR